ncbi:MAG: triosephosphate isomerase [Saprospiraceae bacterium]|jgi:triosephosphate isomerase
MSRQLIAAGNWKMNTTYEEGIKLAQQIGQNTLDPKALVVVAPPYVSLQGVAQVIKDFPQVKLAAQNCHQELKGAYTGEISIDMLIAIGVEYVILGHSERREYNNESNELLAAKVNLVLSKGLIPIFCCGESLAIREAGTYIDFVSKQLTEGLFHLSASDFEKVVIAYEPIWAIGTGVTASPEQAQETHQSIRQLIAEKYNEKMADETTILYGGSVKPSNAKEIFSKPDVDGALVGGASLDAEGFVAIVEAF